MVQKIMGSSPIFHPEIKKMETRNDRYKKGGVRQVATKNDHFPVLPKRLFYLFERKTPTPLGSEM